jgi:Fe-S cluster biogenesis protein NfuA
LVVDLYGSGLERLLDLVHDAGRLDDEVLRRLADDELVSGLLLVHGLHPYGVQERVERALENVRPYLGSHGGDVELLDVSDEGVVRLRLLGSCDGCASSSVTLKLAVEGAIEAAAPEIIRIDVDTSASSATSGVISVDSLTARLRSTDRPPEGEATWAALDEIEQIVPGTAIGRQVAGIDVVLCRLGEALYAYRDACGSCGDPVAGSPIERRLGSGRDSAVLTCRRCHAHFSVQQAGRGLDGTTAHLDPLPLLERGGVVEIAVPSAVPA